jgi:hypothetical protein
MLPFYNHIHLLPTTLPQLVYYPDGHQFDLHFYNFFYLKNIVSVSSVLVAYICNPTTWEEEIEKRVVKASPGEKVSKTSVSTNKLGKVPAM